MSSVVKSDRLQPSPPDLVELGRAIVPRDEEIRFLYKKKWGIALVSPEEVEKNRLIVIEMVVRHRKGDFRNTESEIKAIKEYAQWTLDVKRRLCGQPDMTLEWTF